MSLNIFAVTRSSYSAAHLKDSKNQRGDSRSFGEL